MRKDVDKRSRGMIRALSAWALAVCAVLWAAIAWSPAVFASSAARGELDRWFWVFDVCASLASQSVLVLILVCTIVFVFRRWFAGCAVLLMLVCVIALPWSVPRLGHADKNETSLRLLVFNGQTGSGQVDAKAGLIASADADVLVLNEMPLEFVRRYMMGDVLREYRSGWWPDGPWSGCPLLITRHPVDEHGPQLARIRRELMDHFYRLEIVRSPAGDVAIVQAHARSPRNPARWRVGLDQLLEVADLVAQIREATGLPVVVAGDFNGPPTSVRSRAFAERSGLVRAKPAGKLAGTFPSFAPSALAVPIDDVYASSGVRVKRWEPIGSAGSDHRALVVELVLDQE